MTDLTPQEASEEAVLKAQSAQEAIEVAREVHNQDIIEQTASRTKDALFEGLKEVFGDSEDPQQMKVLVRRIPILCVNVEKTHQDIAEIKKAQEIALINQTNAREDIAAIKDNLKWFTRAVFGAVIVGVVALIFKLLIP